eukprot:1150391-Pelagomonas_calceolata.AAC.8
MVAAQQVIPAYGGVIRPKNERCLRSAYALAVFAPLHLDCCTGAPPVQADDGLAGGGGFGCRA